MIKACIFDLDGTLADTLESIAYSCNEALEAEGFKPLPLNDYKYYAGDGAKVLIERALKAAGDEALLHFNSVYKAYSAFFEKDCTYKVSVFDGLLPVLKQLKEKGLYMAVLSNKPHERAVEVVTKLFGRGFFDVIQGQDDRYLRKPDPAGALHIAEKLHVRPDQCLYVGDTNVDMITGNRAGMHTIGVLWGFRDEKELLGNNAHAVIKAPEELFGLLSRHIKLIVTDVDGTLIENGEPALPKGCVEKLSKLIESGIYVAAASGRQIHSLKKVFAPASDHMYLIGENGSQAAYKGAEIYFKAMDKEIVQHLIYDIKKLGGCEILLSGPDCHFVEKSSAALYTYLTEIVHNQVEAVDDLAAVAEPVSKVALYRSGGTEAIEDYFRKKWSHKLNVAVSSPGWLDFNCLDVSKGEAVEKLQRLMEITPDETMVFGDSGNDLTMLGRARYSYAKSGAMDSVIAASNFVTDDVRLQLDDLIEEISGRE